MIRWSDLNKSLFRTGDTKDIKDYDLKALKNSIINILGINIKELPGRPEFGNTLNAYLFEQITPELNMLFEQDVKLLLRKYEPRIRIESCSLIENPDFNEIICNIDFWIVEDPNQETFNLKTSFYKYNEMSI